MDIALDFGGTRFESPDRILLLGTSTYVYMLGNTLQ
jgi:hypothetical protein